ncbi:helix-turn-helix transcriptional regulator [Deinococcus sp.]|uniref:helix-turn-helix domain-containing protein n=1 Tax=Deinococcus sp. TaxID=47478 RepID=UPI0025BBCD6B|nr:helix-turn-helix transcriptional regulator [Deinococcus sp.]
MNKEIRRQIKAVMKERGISQELLAEQIGMRRTNLNQMLNAETDIPQRWQDIFNALGKKLVLIDDDGKD